MAGIKRKQPEVAGGRVKGGSKKSKIEPKNAKKSARPPTPLSDISELEAETDSDPIIESDTTEHSGDDDGVSWPSDDEEPAVPATKDGGVKFPAGKAKQKDGGVKLLVTQAEKGGVSTDNAKGISDSGLNVQNTS